MKKLIVALLMVVVSASSAMAFSLSNPFYQGPIKFKYSNYENQVLQVGDSLSGIAVFTGIYALDAFNTPLWTPTAGVDELTATFTNYVVKSITPLAGGKIEVNFTGGNIDMYYDTTPDVNVTFPGTGVTDGINFMNLVGQGGIVADPTVTLRSVLDSLTSIGAAQGAGFLQVTGGTYAYLLGGVGATASLESDFSAAGGTRPGFGWPVVSEDPIVGTVVPEPSTMLLLGGGLLGLGLLRKRTRK